MGKLVSSPGALKTVPKTKGETMMETRGALLHSWLRAFGIQSSPVTQLGVQNTESMQRIQTLLTYVDSSLNFLTYTKTQTLKKKVTQSI